MSLSVERNEVLLALFIATHLTDIKFLPIGVRTTKVELQVEQITER